MDVTSLPPLNATLNGIAALFLFLGRMAVKRGKKDLHRRLMTAAMSVSALFLISYLTYHFCTEMVTRYPGTGWLRALYLAILISHSILAPWILPFSIAAVVLAVRQRFEAHTRITRWLWPAWMYVSVTGVIIYLMLYVFVPRSPSSDPVLPALPPVEAA